jgi:PAS domain S-box-containing protein
MGLENVVGHMVAHAPGVECATRSDKRAERTGGPAPAAVPDAYVIALDAVSDPVLIVDRSGGVLYANPALHAVLGEPTGALLGQHWSSIAPGQALALRTILRELAHKHAWSTRVRAQRKDGTHALLDVTLSRVTDQHARLQHFCAVAKPVTSDRGSEVLETMGRLSAEIAHDFNNQIAVVLNYTFILLRQLPADSPLREHVRQLQAAAWRASQVAQEMVTFGGRRTNDPAILDLNAVVAGLGEVLTHALDENVVLEVHAGIDLLPIRARLPHLEWLLLELALHARVFLGSVGRFVIETWNEGPAVARSASPTSSNEVLHGGAPADAQRWVGITVRAVPSPDHHSDTNLMPIRSGFASSQLPENAASLPGAELAVVRANGSISTTRDPDGSITYRVRLPALTQ